VRRISLRLNQRENISERIALEQSNIYAAIARSWPQFADEALVLKYTVQQSFKLSPVKAMKALWLFCEIRI
jgi:hypothetical protein